MRIIVFMYIKINDQSLIEFVLFQFYGKFFSLMGRDPINAIYFMNNSEETEIASRHPFIQYL